MGYMGFGMQSWVYKMRPRKPFSMERKKSFDPLPNYSREFKIQPSKNENVKLKGILTIISALVLCFIFVSSGVKFKELSIIHSVKMEKIRNQKDMVAFNFLMGSGVYRLKHNNIQGAYSEFKLAQNIFPENKEAYQLLLETTRILCKNDNKYCDELDLLMDSASSSE